MSLNSTYFIDKLHQRLGQIPLIVKWIIKLRNQCKCIIKYSISEGADPKRNGEYWLMQTIAPTVSRFVDVGANIGNWTELLIDLINQPVKGLLFEPSQQSFEQLNQRFQSEQRVELINAAVSDQVGKLAFYEEPNAGETSSLVGSFSNDQAVQKLVEVTTLDQEIQRRGWEFIDFLKIDVEGYDFHVIRGAATLLSQQKIGILQFEYNSPWAIAGSTLAAAYNFLESFGYKVFLLRSQGLYELDYNLYGEYFEYSCFVAISPQKLPSMKPYIQGRI